MRSDRSVNIQAADQGSMRLFSERVSSGDWSVPVLPDNFTSTESVLPTAFELQDGEDVFDFAVIGANGLPIAFSRVVVDYQTSDAEIQILCGREDIWDRGEGTDAVLRIIGECVGPLGASHVWVQFPGQDGKVTRLFRKIGFMHEATFRTAGRRHGPHELMVWGMLAARFKLIYGSDAVPNSFAH